MSEPSRLGKYEIQGVLGKGAMGIVYKAVDPHIERTVAIKTLRKDLLDSDMSEQFMGRFRNEAKAAGRLHHPNIVDLVDSGETDDGRPYAAFQYVPGKSLAQVLAQEGPMHPREAKHVMAQVLDALSCAHNLGVVHRDLKPANIMVVSTGTRRNALVLDFGIGAVAEGARGDGYAKLTSQHEWLGTPHYTAPEQVRLVPISEKTMDYARTLLARLKAEGLRATLDEHSDKLGAKIRRAEIDKVPYTLVIGQKEAEAQSVSVRSRAKGDEGVLTADAYIAKLKAEVATRALPEKKKPAPAA